MRVKVGEHWHEAGPGAPIAIEITPRDRANIAAMLPEATRYGVFHAADADRDKNYAWLGE